MRTVVHISDSEEFGGTEQTILELIAGLDGARWRCVLMHRQPSASPLVAGAERLAVPQVTLASARGVRGLGLVPRIAQGIRAQRPAVVHAHLTFPLACKFSLVAAVLARAPAVVATAQLFMELPSTRSARAQHRIVASTVNQYIAVSRHVAASVHERLHVPREKITVIHNAVALGRFPLVSERRLRTELAGGRDVPVVLTVARLDPQKGHTCLLEAAALVPTAVFVIAGDGPENGALQARARALGLHDRVRFLGSRDDVPDLLAACDMLVLPSLYEGLPLAALEAMAAARPVVATAIGGTDEAVLHGVTGLLVPAGDPAALAMAVRALIDNPELARGFGERGRARVEADFAAPAMVRQVAALYDAVLF